VSGGARRSVGSANSGRDPLLALEPRRARSDAPYLLRADRDRAGLHDLVGALKGEIRPGICARETDSSADAFRIIVSCGYHVIIDAASRSAVADDEA
jgi:hypothetical protein